VIVFSEEALADLERILDFTFARDGAEALVHIAKIRAAVMILEEHPEIGRPAEAGSKLRELVISHGRSGYVALYEYSRNENLIRIAAVRHQREAGYPKTR
jgi:plasmid stabilization system protein ParE